MHSPQSMQRSARICALPSRTRDGLGGAALDAVDAPFAQVLVQGDRVNEFFSPSMPPPFLRCSPRGGSNKTQRQQRGACRGKHHSPYEIGTHSVHRAASPSSAYSPGRAGSPSTCTRWPMRHAPSRLPPVAIHSVSPPFTVNRTQGYQFHCVIACGILRKPCAPLAVVRPQYWYATLGTSPYFS